jgi:hypothetical protein
LGKLKRQQIKPVKVIEMNQLPEELQQIQDLVVDHVNKNTPLPKNLDELVDWYEDDGWDLLIGSWGSDHIALKLFDLGCLKFSDAELTANLEEPEPITNELRVTYAREQISNAFENSDGYDCPSVHAVLIKKEDGSSAVLGWTVEIHGQGGPVPEFQGVFSSKSDFYDSLKDFDRLDLLLDKDVEELSDEAILQLWTRLN